MNLNGVLTTTGNNVEYTGGLYVEPTSVVYHYPYYGNWYPTTIEVEPKSCMGKAHVFECDHVSACKCGAIKRVMPRAKR